LGVARVGRGIIGATEPADLDDAAKPTCKPEQMFSPVMRNSLTKSIAYGHGSWISQEAVGVAQHTFVGTDMFAGGVPGS
jgi:hypothetical protein